MKKRFKNNEAVGVCAESNSGLSKKELVAREKQELKNNKARFKRVKKYMNTLRNMAGDYDYNQNIIAELVGGVYMRKDALKGYVEHNKNRIKMLKAK